MSKELESHKADRRNDLKAPLFISSETASSAVSTPSPSTSSLVSFTGVSANASITNGFIRTLSVSSADTGLVSKTVTDRSSVGGSTKAVFGSNFAITTTAANSNGTSSISISTPSFASGSVFKFGSSLEPSASTVSTSASAGGELTGSEVKETGFGYIISSPSGSSLSPITSTGGSLFSGTSSAVKISGNSIFCAASSTEISSNSFGMSSDVATNGSSGIFCFNAGGNMPAVSNQSQIFGSLSAASTRASSAGTSFASASQSTPISSGKSASVPSFGSTSSTTLLSQSALFNSSTSTDKFFSSGASLGLTSSTSAANPVSFTANSTLSSSLPTPNLGSSFSSSSFSNPFVVGASPTSGATTASTSTAPPLFGSSTNASSGSVLNFNSPATATPSQPVFGSTPNPSISRSSPGNNDQMNMEDSMAEDTINATTSMAPVFGQQPVTLSSSTFVFGSTAPMGGNKFPSAGASGTNPFQFGSQSNLQRHRTSCHSRHLVVSSSMLEGAFRWVLVISLAESSSE